ncbi:hypothetical protein ACQZV8_17385, partial [Magnetococcales bacterium HHB-1]
FSRMLKNSICFEVIDTALGYILAEDVVRRSTVMVSKEALQRVCDPELAPQSAGEWNLWLKLCKAGKVAVCREVMVDVDYKRSVQVFDLEYLQESRKIIDDHIDIEVREKMPWASYAAASRLSMGYADYFCRQQKMGRAFLMRLHAYIKNPTWPIAKYLAGDFWRFLQSLVGR